MCIRDSYSPEEYPNYDNYNAINVNKVAEIPFDYAGIIAVSYTHLDVYKRQDYRYRKMGMDEHETNLFGQKNEKDTRRAVSLGFMYTCLLYTSRCV